MINKLWTDVSLENYNNWYPLTGKITVTPEQYIKTWPIVNDWFKTFAMRAQNDINAYLDFVLSKFPFDSFKDELIKETLRDMVYVCVEHWVFNRTPIEFNVDATIQFNNGSQFSANSIPTINVWDLAPSRMKIWAKLTELKQVFSSYNNDEIDVEKIDLQAFYTRTQVNELIEQQKEFTLSKQIKLYDDVITDNEHEVLPGAVSKLVNKSYIATEYDKETETMILNWPNEIGTLPPEALQNNSQVGDFTHAPTADFSVKQQKIITTNENTIKLLENKVEINKQNIDDIKNNWFNIETSPLWKKMSSFIPSSEFGKTYLAIWGYIYQPPSTPTDNYIYSNKKTMFKLSGDIQRTTQKKNKLDELIVNNDTTIQLLYDDNDITVVSNNPNYKSASVELYQYQDNGIPTEFIAEKNTEHDYYTKQETNELLDRKQDKLTAGDNITIDENNVISATGELNPNNFYTKDEIDNNLKISFDFIDSIKQNKLIPNGNIEITEDNKIRAFDASFDNNKFLKNYSLYDSNTELNTSDLVIGTCGYINKWYQNKLKNSNDVNINDDDNTISIFSGNNTQISNNVAINNQYQNLQTTAKTIVEAINELVVRLNNIPQWKEVAVTTDLLTINYVLNDKTHYRIYYNQYNVSGHEIGKNASVISHFYYQIDDKPFPITNFEYSNNIFRAKAGHLWKLEELQDNSSNYEIISNTLQIISPSNVILNVINP
ncbi:hypothetical protein [Spiroplasma ixodetis]|uniref:hypothetical protein n=1 Tax=Spiroplasma ixodetis TaxID=2141 RepID=UPI0025771602|nr:hypothetical protein [Spiroplasma ixodetis]WJG70023.1 hypothetical protein SIXOD_v1c10520 [Spiroplasma ixodetis Y32]